MSSAMARSRELEGTGQGLEMAIYELVANAVSAYDLEALSEKVHIHVEVSDGIVNSVYNLRWGSLTAVRENMNARLSARRFLLPSNENMNVYPPQNKRQGLLLPACLPASCHSRAATGFATTPRAWTP